MPTSFNDLPPETKLKIIHWAHWLDTAMRIYGVGDKRGGSCDALFQVNRQLSELAAEKVFEVSLAPREL
jgi:hypothetical protein